MIPRRPPRSKNSIKRFPCYIWRLRRKVFRLLTPWLRPLSCPCPASATMTALITALLLLGSVTLVCLSPAPVRLSPASFASDATPSDVRRDKALPEDSPRFQWHNRVLQFMETPDTSRSSVEAGSPKNSHLDSPQPSPITSTFQGEGLSSRNANPNLHPSPPSSRTLTPDSNRILPSPHRSLHQPTQSSYVQEAIRTSSQKLVISHSSNISQHHQQQQHPTFLSNRNVSSNSYPVLRGESALHNSTAEVAVKRLPQAVIVGAKKSGTRALLEYLRLHPGVVAAGPEPHFFDRNYDKGLHWYRELMPKSYSDQLTLEKTPAYFITPEVPRLLHDMNPEVKILLVVRDPVTRAISDYVQACTKRPLTSFEHMAMLDARLGLINTSWAAVKIGLYAKHMQGWLDVFRRSQIHLVDGQRLITSPAQEMAKVEEFLQLPPYITEDHFFLKGFKGTFPCIRRGGRAGVGGVPHCLDERTKGRDHPQVADDVINRLRDFYRPFNHRFYQMVGRDFGWL